MHEYEEKPRDYAKKRAQISLFIKIISSNKRLVNIQNFNNFCGIITCKKTNYVKISHFYIFWKPIIFSQRLAISPADTL